MFEKFTGFLEKRIQPVAEKMSQNTIIQSITEGMLGILVLNIGASFISILINLPIEPWLNLLNNSGIMGPAQELISATTSLLALYIVISISFSYAKNTNIDIKSTVLISVAVFLILIPQSIEVGEESIAGLQLDMLGSNGIFVAIIVSVLISWFYKFLIDHNFQLKLPEQVPTMVTQSMAPILSAMVIFTVSFIFKYILSLTAYGNVFELVYNFLTIPAMAFGSTGWTVILWCVLRSVFWFFGIHPSPLNAIYFPISAAVLASNVEAYMAGNPLPHLDFAIMAAFCLIGGSGSTFALSLNMFSAKSERYKSLNKIAFIPGLFNINEPYVFGVPLMLNPVMLVPMVLAPLVGGLVGYAFIGLDIINSFNFNPTISVAWVIPYPIAAFLRGGLPFMAGTLVAILFQYFIYKPFFNVIDKVALEEEK